jgi:hypothetical protein
VSRLTQVLTAALTVVLGFVVFVLGQIAQRFFIEPIQEQRRVIGEIAHATVYYGNVGKLSEPERRLEASGTLHELASKLRSTLWTVPLYKPCQFLGLVKREQRVLTASSHLIGWSNSVISAREEGTYERQQAIIEALNLPPA